MKYITEQITAMFTVLLSFISCQSDNLSANHDTTEVMSKRIIKETIYNADEIVTSERLYTYHSSGYDYIEYIYNPKKTPSLKAVFEENEISTICKYYSYIDNGWNLSFSAKQTYSNAKKEKLLNITNYDSNGQITGDIQYTYHSSGYDYIQHIYNPTKTPSLKAVFEENEISTICKYYSYIDNGWNLSFSTKQTYSNAKKEKLLNITNYDSNGQITGDIQYTILQVMITSNTYTIQLKPHPLK